MRYKLVENRNASPIHMLTMDSPRDGMGMLRDLDRAGELDYMARYFDRPVEELMTWFGRDDLDSFSRAFDAVSELWPYGISLLDECRSQVRKVSLPRPQSVRRLQGWADQDGDFDLNNFCDGRPAFRGSVRRIVTGVQFVSVVVPLVANRDQSAGEIFWRGLATALITELLESEGYSVEVVAYIASERTYISGDDFCLGIKVKEYSQPLDLKSLVNVVSPWYYRTVGFATYMLIDGQKVMPRLGFPATASDEILRLLCPADDRIILEGCRNRKECVELVGKTLRSVGRNFDG